MITVPVTRSQPGQPSVAKIIRVSLWDRGTLRGSPTVTAGCAEPWGEYTHIAPNTQLDEPDVFFLGVSVNSMAAVK